MGANYKQLLDFQKKIERLNSDQKEEFLEACCKELAARLLAKVVHDTPVGEVNGGTLRRGWTAGQNTQASQYAQSLNVQKVGNTYHIDIINPVEYASYVEYGHRKSNGQGWVPGRFMLTIAESELNRMTPQILQKKLNQYIKKAFNE